MSDKTTYHLISIEEHKSLHSYLDAAFKDIPYPSNDAIILAKKEYWRQYYRIYRKNYRKHLKEYRLHFEAETLEQIKEQKGKLSVSKFLYQCVQETLDSERELQVPHKQFETISHQLLKITYLLEEIVDNDGTELTYNIIERITVLETDIQQLISQTCGH